MNLETSAQPPIPSWQIAQNIWLPHALVVLMLACLGWFASLLFTEISVQLGLPYFSGHLPWEMMAIALAAIVGRQRRSQSLQGGNSVTMDFVVEWLVIIFSLKFIPYLWLGLAQLWADLQSWQADFLPSFFSVGFFVNLLLAFVVWWQATRYAEDLHGLSGDEQKLVDRDDILHSQRSLLRQHLVGRFLSMGLVMVFLTVLFTPPEWLGFDTPTVDARRSAIVPIMVYFLAGLLLLSLANLAVLRAVWAWENTPFESGLQRRWLLYTQLILLLVLILALLLPVGSVSSFFDGLKYVFAWMAAALYGLFFLISLPFFLLLGLLMGLSSDVEPEVEMLPTPQAPIVPETMQTPESLPLIFAVLQSVAFWLIFVLVVGFAFQQYIRRNRALWLWLRQAPAWRWLQSGWAWLRGLRMPAWVRNLGEQATLRWSALRSAAVRQAGATGLGFRLRRLTARQKLIFYYLSLLRRAAEHGLPRQPDQTPREYSQQLEAALTEVEPEVQILTNAFQEARYTAHPVEPPQVANVQSAWQRLRKVLRERKK